MTESGITFFQSSSKCNQWVALKESQSCIDGEPELKCCLMVVVVFLVDCYKGFVVCVFIALEFFAGSLLSVVLYVDIIVVG